MLIKPAYIPGQRVFEDRKEADPPRRTLANQDCGIYANRCPLIRDETGVNGGSGGDKGCTAKTMGMYRQHYKAPQIRGERVDLIPVVTAT